MSFLADYLKFNEGNECPTNYHIWSAFAVLSSVVSRRVRINQGYFEIYPNLFICLVGKQGNRKTTAKDIAYDLLREVCPDIPVSAESMSKEAITKFMADDENARYFKNNEGQLVEYHPFSMFITELKNFLSINPISMVDFLTTIYDRKFYDVITKNKGTDTIINPFVVFLACETPEWIVARLKESVISGGFSRRTIFVYETKYGGRIPFPEITTEAAEAWARCKAHLVKLKEVSGTFTWHPDAVKFYSRWYTNLKFPSDPMLEGYYQSKHIQLLKICMLLVCCEFPIKLELTTDHLQVGMKLLDDIEVNMPRLSEGVGRNELAHPTSKLMDILETAGGEMSEKKLKSIMWANAQGTECNQILDHLVMAERIYRLNETMGAGELPKVKIVTAKRYQQIIEAKRLKGNPPI